MHLNHGGQSRESAWPRASEGNARYVCSGVEGHRETRLEVHGRPKAGCRGFDRPYRLSMGELGLKSRKREDNGEPGLFALAKIGQSILHGEHCKRQRRGGAEG